MSLLHRSFIFSLLLINALVYSPALLDYFHHSRFLYGALSLTAFSLLFGWQANKNKAYEASIQDALILTFTMLNFLSIFWSSQFSETIFYAQKWLIFLSAFVLIKYVFQQNFEASTHFVSSLACVLTLVIVALVSIHMTQLVVEQGMSNKALYNLKAVFGHKSLISTYLVLLIPLNLLGWRMRSKKINAAVAVLLISQVVLIFLLQSRTMYLALLALAVVALHFLYRENKLINRLGWKSIVLAFATTALGAIAIYKTANSEMRERLNPLQYLESQTSGERRFVWYKTQGLIYDDPILGVGAGNWKLEFPKYGVEGAYRLQDQDVIFTRAHNDFLEICAELGIIGLLCYLLIFVLAFIHLVRKRTPNQNWIKHLLAGGIISFVISSLLDFPKERVEFLIMLAFYLAMADEVGSRSVIKIGGNRLRGVLLLMGLVLACTAYTGIFRFKGEARLRKVFAARLVERWEEVISASKEATNTWYRLDPSAVPIAFYQGIAHYSLGDERQALEAFTMARAHNPNNFHVINNMATVLVGQAKYEEALGLLYQALSINPRFEEAIYNLAFCLNATGRHQEALDQVTLIPGNSEKKKVFIREITKVLNN